MAPRAQAMETQIKDFIRSRFAARHPMSLEADTLLFSGGIIDSFGFLELLAFLNQTFAVDIDPGRHDLSEFDTIDKIAALVRTLTPLSDR